MREKLLQPINKLANVVEKVSWEKPGVYANYLAQTYFYVCHSTRLLALAASRVDRKFESVHQRFIKHLSEENKHEILAERDVKALGFDIHEITELPATKAFYQSQYYNIEHRGAFSLFGWVLALEGLAALKGNWLHDTLKTVHGPKACGFIRVHAEEDMSHFEKAIQNVETLGLSDQKIVFDVLDFSCHFYSLILTEVSKEPISNKKLKAA